MFERVFHIVQVKDLAERGPEGEVHAEAPSGYVLDTSSGYYYNAETGLYYDASSGGYFSSSTNKWYSYDGQTGQYNEWPASGS
jgi:CD2 antigen cytoplasmic tail-binding protein 2